MPLDATRLALRLRVLVNCSHHHALEAREVFDHQQLLAQGGIEVLCDFGELLHVGVDVEEVRNDQRLDQILKLPGLELIVENLFIKCLFIIC